MNNVFISCKESRIENNRSFYGCFNLGVFDAAQSLTVANALRRTLLSECPGLGIISVTIENVSHEYSTLPGMRESVLDLLLNLKEIVFSFAQWPGVATVSPSLAHDLVVQSAQRPDYQGTSLLNSFKKGPKKPVVGYLKVKGPGVIRARDLKLPPLIQCVDPDQYIATLAEDGFLSMTFIIMEGKGYLIQKSSASLIDNTFITKRTNLLNELKSSGVLKNSLLEPFYSKNRSSGLKGLGQTTAFSLLRRDSSSPRGYKGLKAPSMVSPSVLSQRDKAEGSLYNSHQASVPSLFPFKGSFETQQTEGNHQGESLYSFAKEGKSSLGTSTQNEGYRTMSFATRRQTLMFKGKSMQESKPLNLDCIFNPVTKVSYVIEDFDNHITNDFNNNLNFMNNISSLIESSHYLKKNFPFLLDSITKETDPEHLQTELSLNRKSLPHLEGTFTKSEIQELSSYLHPLKKQNSLHNIVIEIWTNGSLHPREALSLGFQNLGSLFLNLQKTKVF